MGYKAGLAESCSHIATVLFYLEAWTKINGRRSCTQVKCTWLLQSCVNQVDYARVRDIIFTLAKSDLDASLDNVPNDSFPVDYKLDLPVTKKLSKEVPAPRKAEMEQFFAELSKSKNKPIAPSLIPEYAGSYVLKRRSAPTIKHLSENKYLDLTHTDLLKVCQEIDIKITTEQITQIERDTITQAKGTSFFKHSAGRIGSSQCKAACNCDPALPSQTLIQSICHPELNKINTKAVLHGCKHEGLAIRAYEEKMKELHTNFKIIRCGLLINDEYPWLHATPDFLCSCDCCGEGCGEVKCPFCIENCDFDNYNCALRAINGFTEDALA